MGPELSTINNNELSCLYLKYKKKLKVHKSRGSFYDLNKVIEIKNYLSLLKWEMKNRGMNHKEIKKKHKVL
jgi:hypothetical protein